MNHDSMVANHINDASSASIRKIFKFLTVRKIGNNDFYIALIY